jgi:hypothetical protein
MRSKAKAEAHAPHVCGVPARERKSDMLATSQANALSHSPPLARRPSQSSSPVYRGLEERPPTMSSNKKSTLTGYLPDILMAAAAVRTLPRAHHTALPNILITRMHSR